MLKEKIMRFCIHSLLKIEEYDGGLRTQSGEDGEMDEEDHEALCNLFRTIGDAIDNPKAQPYMKVYFGKIDKLSDDKALSSRLRFMYKDLIEMRSKGWKLRREVETAKSLDEIRKDAEREERMAQMQSQQGGGGGRGRGRGGGYDSGRGGGRSYDGGRGGRGGYDGGRGGYDPGRGGHDAGRGGGRGYDGGRGGRGGNRDENRGYDNRGPDRNTGYSSGRSGPAPTSARAPPVVGGQGILPPRTSGAGAVGSVGPPGQVLTEEKLKQRANNIRKEWLQDLNESELMMSVDEVLATPGASKTIVQTNIEYTADCKLSELQKIIDMIMTLYLNKKVSGSDIEAPMTDLVEFIDSYACDNPQVFHYVGQLFSTFSNASILTAAWLCDCTSRVAGDDCKFKVIEEAMKSLKCMHGVKGVVSCFGGDKDALERLLGPAKVKELSSLMV